ncbi:hypothetical protein PR048_022493 [Dryococelus australis]|uniref:Uncharacterized protein n=1 Tax=Dryococelus australis TaxID=614101 RepID=A0ABQ9H172_9NEOP|nr:hypothetical protein PR048_022493 [Dryococelus australis]
MKLEIKEHISAENGITLQVFNTNLHFKIGKHCWTCKFWVIPGLISELDLGFNFLQETKAFLDFNIWF